MNINKTHKQPHNVGFLSELEYNRVLLQKIEEKISALDSSKDSSLIFQLKKLASIRREELDIRQRHFDSFIDEWKQQPNLTELDKKCVGENEEKLKKKQQEYSDLYQKSELVKDIYVDWKLDVKAEDLNKVGLFYPSQINELFGEQGSSPLNVKNTCLTAERTVNLSLSSFVYDDGVGHEIDPRDSVASHRFVWFWDSTNLKDYHHANIALTNTWGQPSPVHCDSDFVKLSDRKFILYQPKQARGLPALLTTTPKPPIRSGGRSKPEPRPPMPATKIDLAAGQIRNNTKFLAYPLDKFKFISKPLNELTFGTELTEIECRAEELLKSEQTEFKSILNPEEIKVHCSLPEWDFRLRRALNKLQRQIGEYNLLLSDYMARLAILDDMINLVKLQTEFPFKELEELRSGMFAADTILRSKEKEQIKKAKNNRELYQALCTIREKMVSAVDQEESFLTFSKGHKDAEKHQKEIDNVAERLYALLTAPALRTELNCYIDSLTKQLADGNVVDRVINDGFIPPGPYHEDEGNWCVIFNTIAECYGALASSAKYRKKLFEEQIKPSINVLIANDTGHKIETEFKEVWDPDVIGRVTETTLPKDSYLLKQTRERVKAEDPKDNLLSDIFDTKTVQTLEQLWTYRGLVIPGPGAPCLLQVILSSYSTEVMTHLTKKVQGASVSHLRFFNAVLRHWKVRDLFDKKSFKEVFMSYAIVYNGNRRRNQKLVQNGRKVLDDYSRELAKGTGKHSRDLFDHTLDSAASPYNGIGYAKVLYVFYNFTINVQNNLALEEQALREKWSAQKTTLEIYQTSLDLMASRLQLVSDTANIARSIEVALARLKAQGPIDTSTLRLGQVGKILDHISIVTTVLSLISTSIDIHIAFDNNDIDAELIAKGASFVADSTILVGWLTGIGILMVVGYVVTVVIVAHEISKFWAALNQTQIQKRLLAGWAQFKSNLDKETTRKYLQKVIDQSGITEDLEFGLNEHFEFILAQSPERVLKVIAPDVIETIDEKLSDDLEDWILPGFSYVELGNMSWRAVIPLHLLGYSNELIDEFVELDPELKDFTGINSVNDIIDYYKEIKKHEKSNSDRGVDSDPSTHLYIGPGMRKNYGKGVDWGELARTESGIDVVSIAQLLEIGLFTPPARSGQEFFLNNVWDHPSFRIPKLLEESIHGEQQ